MFCLHLNIYLLQINFTFLSITNIKESLLTKYAYININRTNKLL